MVNNNVNNNYGARNNRSEFRDPDVLNKITIRTKDKTPYSKSEFDKAVGYLLRRFDAADLVVHEDEKQHVFSAEALISARHNLSYITGAMDVFGCATKAERTNERITD